MIKFDLKYTVATMDNSKKSLYRAIDCITHFNILKGLVFVNFVIPNVKLMYQCKYTNDNESTPMSKFT